MMRQMDLQCPKNSLNQRLHSVSFYKIKKWKLLGRPTRPPALSAITVFSRTMAILAVEPLFVKFVHDLGGTEETEMTVKVKKILCGLEELIFKFESRIKISIFVFKQLSENNILESHLPK